MALCGQLTSWLQDQITQLAHVGLLVLPRPQVLLEHRKQVCSCLSTSGDGMSQYVVPLEHGWNRLSLDHGRMVIVKLRARSDERL